MPDPEAIAASPPPLLERLFGSGDGTSGGALRWPRVRPSTWLYLLVAFAATAPAWIVKHPPLQDLPFHLATIRLVHDYANPHYGFARAFEVDLIHTQYVLYYVVGSMLAYLVGVFQANVALMCAYLGGTVLALRELCLALKKDERLCLFVVPLLVNPMFMMGLLPFIVGIPLMFWALALSVRYFEEPTRNRGIVLGGVAVALFYLHILPFALFGLGFAAMFPWDRPREWIRAGAPVVPGLLVAIWWIFGSASGGEALNAVGSKQGATPFTNPQASFTQWSIDVFNDASDEQIFFGLVLLAILCAGLAQGERDRTRKIARGYVVVPIACFVLYLTMGDNLGSVWLFSQRFPILALMTAIPLLRLPTGMRGVFAATALAALGSASIANTCQHFIQFEKQEVGNIDDAVRAMEPAKRVAGLIYDRGSSIVHYAPFLHFVSYYQLEKGGVVEFSYASWGPHWPIRFKPGQFPPPGGPLRKRWEWTPEQVTIDELMQYYDYVLTRGNGFRPPAGTYHVKWKDSHWTVWARDGGS
jgi:hypothetical protein